MRREIRWAHLRDDGTGHEQRGHRPILVLGNNDTAQVVTVIPLTTALGASRYGVTLDIKKTDLNGLPKDSLALIFQVTTLDQRRLGELIGHLESDVYDRILSILCDYCKRPE